MAEEVDPVERARLSLAESHRRREADAPIIEQANQIVGLLDRSLTTNNWAAKISQLFRESI